MSIFKCKMCGGTIEFNEGDTIGVCDSCGTKQTLPRLDSDRKTNLYDRANHFRRNNEFDKAMSIYENILNEDQSDAEAYWSIVLCRYGIEYVEDPATHRRVPTVNRAQFTSIFDDEDYKSALKNADALQRSIYEEEAKTINEIQKGILEISAKEEPFDVFICYKETDANGRRTPDSVLATDLYHQLTNEGFKVFFSRITLEDKLGTAYEPYIFAALNSAKAMVVLGTKPEHFNAVWVKNEWSRYLALIKAGAKKTLIPAYRDMDPYDLPEEFSHLQAQDMSKLGFMQDLIRGIKKIVRTEEPKQTTIRETVVQQAAQTNTAPLLRRAFMFLEDSNWQSADEYCEKVLDLDPENAEAYLGKLMAELHVRTRDVLKDADEPFDDSNNYKKAYRFGDDKLKAKLSGDIAFINERNENARLTGIYNNGVKAMNAASTESAYRSAAATFKTIPGFKDADVLADRCLEQAEICRKNAIYQSARSQMIGSTVSGYESAIKTFQTIPGWKDADEQILACQRRIEEIKAKEEAAQKERARKAEEARIAEEKAAKKRKRTIAIVTPIIVACIAFVIVLTTVIIPNQKYAAAVELYNSGKYEEAIAAFTALEGYKDSAAQIEKCETAIKDEKYVAAVELYNSGKYEEAIAAFTALDSYNDSVAQIEVCETAIKDEKYAAAVELYTAGKYDDAIIAFTAIDKYKDSSEIIEKCETAMKDEKYVKATELYNAGEYEEAKNIFQTINGYKNSGDLIDKCSLIICHPWDTITFGKNTDGKIEWLVIHTDGDRKLLLCKKPVCSMAFGKNIEWEDSNVRKWLNSSFFNSSFSSIEKKLIVKTTVKTLIPIMKYIDGGSYETADVKEELTDDYVFLISAKEFQDYSVANHYELSGSWWTRDALRFSVFNGIITDLRFTIITDMVTTLYSDPKKGAWAVGDEEFSVVPLVWIDVSSIK
ncbi:MAG: TIR domain-containing protein [Clostridia bacterium]|nr:TIR domain-containing protein [Clostridia bacterium]